MKEAVETSEVLAFVRVVDAKSFSCAAAELGVPRESIGRRLARLVAERSSIATLARGTAA